MQTQRQTIDPIAAPQGAAPVSQDHRRVTHLVFSVTRYASLDASSLAAAIANGLEELFPEGDKDVPAGSTLYVYYRNRHGSTVTVDVCVPIADLHGHQPISGAIRRRQKGHRVALQPPAAGGGLEAMMDTAARQLGLVHRVDLPDCWQTFALPFAGYDATAPLFVGHVRNHRPGY